MINTRRSDWFYFAILECVINGIFGSIFAWFVLHPEKRDECNNTDFQSWCLAAAFSCIMLSILSILFVFLSICGGKFFMQFLEYSLYACIVYCGICVSGLNGSLDEKCRRLHTLASIYIIFCTLTFSLALIGICLIFCLSFLIIRQQSNNNINPNINDIGEDDEQALQQANPQIQQQNPQPNQQNYQALQ